MAEASWKSMAVTAASVVGIGVGLGVAVNVVAVPVVVRTVVDSIPIEAFREARRGGERAADRLVSSYVARGLAPESSDVGDGGRGAAGSIETDDAGGLDGEGGGSQARERRSASVKAGSGARSEGDDGEGAEEGSSESAGPEERTVVLSRRAIEKRLRRPGRVTRKIGIAETEEGLRVRQLGGYFGELGLRRGDLIQEIEGRVVRRRTEAIALIRERRNQSTFRARILRDGRPIEMTFRVPKVDAETRVEGR